MNNKISNVLKSELINTAEMLAVFYALENDNVRSLTSEKPNIAYLVVDVLYFHSPDLGVSFTVQIWTVIYTNLYTSHTVFWRVS